MPENQDRMREHLVESLMEVIKQVLESYKNFAVQEIKNKDENVPVPEAGDFKAHHDASKSAISHLECILRVAEKQGVNLDAENEDKVKAFADILRRAQESIHAYKNQEKI